MKYIFTLISIISILSCGEYIEKPDYEANNPDKNDVIEDSNPVENDINNLTDIDFIKDDKEVIEDIEVKEDIEELKDEDIIQETPDSDILEPAVKTPYARIDYCALPVESTNYRLTYSFDSNFKTITSNKYKLKYTIGNMKTKQIK